MRNLFRAMTEFDNMPDLIVVMSLTYRFHVAAPDDVHITHRRKLWTWQGVQDHESLTVKLLEVEIGEVRHHETVDLSRFIKWRQVSKEDVLDFVHDVNDLNPIHRREPYHMPGCLLLEWLRDYTKPTEVLDLRFHHSLCAGDWIYLDPHDDGGIIWCERGLVATYKVR